MNFIDAILEKNDTGYYAMVDETKFPLSYKKFANKNLDEYIGKKVVMGIRSEDVVEVKNADLRSDVLDTVVEVYEHMGAEIFVYIDYNCQKIIARFNSDSSPSMDDNLKITFKPDKIHLFDKETEISFLELENPGMSW